MRTKSSVDRAVYLTAALGMVLGSALQARATTTPPVVDATVLASVRTLDATLARVGYRLATANAPLCDDRAATLGLLLHSQSQYAPSVRSAARSFFGFGDGLGIEAVVPESPASIARLEPDDVVRAIGSIDTRTLSADAPAAAASTAVSTMIDRAIGKLSPNQPVAVRFVRAGREGALMIRPVVACATRFEAEIGRGFPARADGYIVQIGSRFIEEYPEAQLAAVVAHELAHNILRHRTRLDAAGRNFGTIRQTELEADLLSVTLMRNAGYDPSAALQFWASFGPRVAAGLKISSHPPWRDRMAMMARAIAVDAADDANPGKPGEPPAILVARDRRLDGNWRALLDRAPVEPR